jgi:hypothetical protein
VTGNTGTKPDINFGELDLLGFTIKEYLSNSLDSNGVKNLLAKWANIVKVLPSGRTTTGQPVEQSANANNGGFLPSDSDIAAVTAWRNP